MVLPHLLVIAISNLSGNENVESNLIRNFPSSALGVTASNNVWYDLFSFYLLQFTYIVSF